MATAVIIILLSVVVAVLSVLTVLVLRRTRIRSTDIEPAVAKAWKDSGLDQRLGQLTAYAEDIQETHRSVEQMLRVPKERASMGELSLETILSDQLPPEMFAMRERVLDGKVPDAHIRSTVGLICIDSKFPLDNYRSMVESAEKTGTANTSVTFSAMSEGISRRSPTTTFVRTGVPPSLPSPISPLRASTTFCSPINTTCSGSTRRREFKWSRP